MTGKRMVCQVHGYLSLVVMLLGVTRVTAEDASKPRVGLKEPVLHVAKSTSPNFHPLDGALELARKGLDTVHTSIADYTCTLVKRERVGGTLGDHEYMLGQAAAGRDTSRISAALTMCPRAGQ